MTAFSLAYNRRRLLPVIVLFFCEIARSSFIFGILPNRSTVLSLSVISYAIAAHYAVDTLSKLWIGWLLDHFSKRWVVTINLLISFVSLIELGQVSKSIWVIAWAAAFGLGTSSIWMYVLHQATTLETDAARNLMSKVFTAWFAAVGIGYAIGNASVISDSSRLTLLLYLVWGLAVLMTLILPKVVSAGERSFSILEGFRSEAFRKAWYAIPGMFIQTLAASALLPIVQSFLQRHLGLTLPQLIWIGASGGVSLLIGLTIIGRIPALPYRKMLSIGLFILAVGIFTIGLMQSMGTLILLAIIIGGSYSLVLSSWNALLLSIVPKKNQGLGWGVFSMIEGAGMAAGSSLSGMLVGAFGANVSFFFSGSLLFFLGLWYLPYRTWLGSIITR